MAAKLKIIKSHVEKKHFQRAADAPIDSESSDTETASTIPQWMQKPSNFLQTATFWQILWSYALDHLASIKKNKRLSNQNYDYMYVSIAPDPSLLKYK